MPPALWPHLPQAGDHFCRPRAAHAVAFCQELRRHTKDRPSLRRARPRDQARIHRLGAGRPDGVDEGRVSMLWRCWLPQAAVVFLDQRTNGKVSQWSDGGWITVTPGDVIDYGTIYADIAEDCRTFRVMAAEYDERSGEPVRQAIEDAPGSTSRRSRRPTAA